MKKIFLMFLSFLFVIPIGGCALKKIPSDGGYKQTKKKELTKWEEILKRGYVNIGVENNDFFLDFVSEMEKENGINVEIFPFNDFNDAKEALESRKIDTYFGMFPKESEQSLDFLTSSPYMKISCMIISANEKYIPDKKKDVCAVGMYSPVCNMSDIYFDNIVKKDSAKAQLNAVLNNEADCAVVCENDITKEEIEDLGLYENENKSFNIVSLYSDESEDVAKEMDVYIAKVKATGVVSELCENYYGNDYIYK